MDENNEKFALKYHCKTCDYYTSSSGDIKRHNKTRKHKMQNNMEVAEKTRVKYTCEYCDIVTSNKYDFSQHIKTNKHKFRQQNAKSRKSCKTRQKYYCNICDYTTSNKYNIQQHFKTIKHKKNEMVKNDNKMVKNGNKMVKNDNKMVKNDNETCKKAKNLRDFNENLAKKRLFCACGKTYTFQSGLIRHKKNCTFEEKSLSITQDNIIIETIDKSATQADLLSQLTTGFMEVIKDNQKLMQAIIPKIGNNNSSNSNNKFNLQVFLNEQCKDALNLSEFVKNIKMEYSDLDYTVENGLSNSIANVFMRNLKELDQCKRPIHCTDSKRHVLYIKDDDKWEKDAGHEKMRKQMRVIKEKHVDTLCGWQGEFPDCWNTKNKLCDTVMHYTSKTCAELTEKAKISIVNQIARSIPPIKK